jgi:hypothetical protein
MHEELCVTQKVDNKAKVFTLSQNIHRSKLVDITTLDVRLGRTCWFMVFLAMVGDISSTKKIEMEKPPQ